LIKHWKLPEVYDGYVKYLLARRFSVSIALKQLQTYALLHNSITAYATVASAKRYRKKIHWFTVDFFANYMI
jgi:hypothetical protein